MNVTVRKIESAGAAVTAVTSAGANILSGPDLRMSDPEKAANSAYRNAYKAAKSRAEAYAEAAGMKVSRVLSIRDAGGTQGTLHTCRAGETFGVLTLEQFVAKLPTVEAPPLNSLAVFSKVKSSPFWLLARHLAAASPRAG